MGYRQLCIRYKTKLSRLFFTVDHGELSRNSKQGSNSTVSERGDLSNSDGNHFGGGLQASWTVAQARNNEDPNNIL